MRGQLAGLAFAALLMGALGCNRQAEDPLVPSIHVEWRSEGSTVRFTTPIRQDRMASINEVEMKAPGGVLHIGEHRYGPVKDGDRIEFVDGLVSINGKRVEPDR